MKPVIGITLDYETKQTATGGYSNRPWYALRVDYAKAVSDAGGVALLLPYITQNIDAYLALCHGLLIPGGDYDINPAYYGEEVESSSNIGSNHRVEFESKLLKAAMAKQIPILGICAGQQLLNVICSGTLIQHLPDEQGHSHHGNQDELRHVVNIVPGTLLSKVVGVDQYLVNSHHHQAVRKIGRDLIINATAPDGVIEGIEHAHLPFCLGVEWHPEYMQSEGDQRIIQALVQAAKQYRAF